jgi:hypothetical protein
MSGTFVGTFVSASTPWKPLAGSASLPWRGTWPRCAWCAPAATPATGTASGPGGAARALCRLLAAERGVSRPVLVEQLRDATGELAVEYENVAYAGVVETEQDRVLASLAGKRD